ncbi:Os11g0533000 [Oryza sativa Japonica Group]|uniref:Uncharacterized protein n=2 Tax=Oryza sativa subsp. japonica TaxID=39947 RepID=Q2R379_ORYSJ|nr:hypothetical protein LOC_Os11g32870 [Oryza sativa Japonica Group]BAH95300.1 Os11g0533000 [Oryza sativa Japonica Group]|eukprot:NP_001176572.1 Os11g0533000 [Oryza sativa Japonica Group]
MVQSGGKVKGEMDEMGSPRRGKANGRYCAKFIPNQNYPFPIRIVMLSALSKPNPTIDAGQYQQGPYMQYSLIDSFLASEQKGLRGDTLSAANLVLYVSIHFLSKLTVQPYKGGSVVGLRMEDNMMYPIKDQETMLHVTQGSAEILLFSLNLGYRIEIQVYKIAYN